MRDEIGGVEQVPVKNPDGTTTYITRRLPLTPEQQAKQNEFESIRNNALAEIKKLTSGTFQEDDEVRNVLSDWEAQQKELLNDSQNARALKEEQDLTRRGLGNSTVSQGLRRQRDLDQQNALQQISRERRVLSDSVRAQKLELQNNLFQVADQGQSLDTAHALQAGVASQGLATAINASNNASLRDYYARQVTAAQSKGPGLFSNVLGAAAGSITGVASGGLLSGGFFSSLFGRR